MACGWWHWAGISWPVQYVSANAFLRVSASPLRNYCFYLIFGPMPEQCNLFPLSLFNPSFKFCRLSYLSWIFLFLSTTCSRRSFTSLPGYHICPDVPVLICHLFVRFGDSSRESYRPDYFQWMNEIHDNSQGYYQHARKSQICMLLCVLFRLLFRWIFRRSLFWINVFSMMSPLLNLLNYILLKSAQHCRNVWGKPCRSVLLL